MIEFIVAVIGIIIGWTILKMIFYRINPTYGLKEAERRYKENPSDVNDRLVWDARSRVKNKNSQ